MARLLFLALLLPCAAISVAVSYGLTVRDWTRAYWLIAAGRSGP